MTEKEDRNINSIEILAEDIFSFTNDIECLHTTLPLIMKVMQTVNEATWQKYLDFIEKNAVEKVNNEDSNTYRIAIKMEDISHFNQLKRQNDNSHAAMKLVPRNFVTSLVSQYDSFLGRIIRFIYSVKPEVLNASEKTIPYTDLIQFSNIDAAKEYIIEKEVETIIRKSHTDQFSWLKEKLGTPFNKDLKCWPVFIELTERRNLFVHCDGKVSSQYIKVCSENKSSIPENLNIGDQLSVSPQYFEEAYKCIYEITAVPTLVE